MLKVARTIETEERVHAFQFALPVRTFLSDRVSPGGAHNRPVNAAQDSQINRTRAANIDCFHARFKRCAPAIEDITRTRSSAGVAKSFDVVVQVVAGGRRRSPRD